MTKREGTMGKRLVPPFGGTSSWENWADFQTYMNEGESLEAEVFLAGRLEDPNQSVAYILS